VKIQRIMPNYEETIQSEKEINPNTN